MSDTHLTASPNVSTSSPCPVGYCALHPLGDLPDFVKCWPEPPEGCASLSLTSIAPIGVQPVPTLSEWSVLATVVLLAIVGWIKTK